MPAAPARPTAANTSVSRPGARPRRRRRSASSAPATARHTPRNSACECFTVNSASSDPPTSAYPARARPARSTSAHPHTAARVSAISRPSAIGRMAVVPHGST